MLPHAQLATLAPTDLTPHPNQPRKNFHQESLHELAQSVKIHGILQPLVVTPNLEKTPNHPPYCIVAGERRWRAAQLAGLTELPCLIRPLEEHTTLEIALIENLQRENLSPIEEAQGFKMLMDEHNYTQEQLAERLGKSRPSIANHLRLLQLPLALIADLEKGLLTSGHGRALCALSDPQEQLRLSKVILKRKLSVRQTEDLVRRTKEEGPSKQSAPPEPISADLRYVCDQLKAHLGAKVRILGDHDKGRIEISYYNVEDLDRLTDLILGPDGA